MSKVKNKANKLEKNFFHVDNRKSDKKNTKTKKNRSDDVIDEEYLDYVRNLTCCVKNCTGNAVPHHLIGRNLGRNDHLVINLCGFHHNLGGINEAIHQMGKESWQKKFKIDIQEGAIKLYERYKKEVSSAKQ